MGSWLFNLLIALTVALMALVVVDLFRRRASFIALGGGTAVVAAILGLALIWWPYYASTGAECGISPTTEVLGKAGSSEQVEEAPEEIEKLSTMSCISRARWRTAGGTALVVMPWAGYLLLTRTGPKSRARGRSSTPSTAAEN